MLKTAQFSLCVDGVEFRDAMVRDILAAKERVYVHTLSFEGDAAGRSLADSMLASKARDKRILADSITELLVNDCFIYTPRSLAKKELQAEVKATRAMYEELRGQGIQLALLDPIGWMIPRLLIRNHKKIIVIDDEIAYLGGLNFSDHNFAWHDLMIRIESEEVVEFLSRDFLASWNGENRVDSANMDGIELYTVDGKGNETILEAVRDLIAGARDRIYLQCPYITAPFFEMLGDASRRGVEVTAVISEEHNRGLMKEGIVEACRREGIHTRFFTDRMTHAKALLIDDDALVLGSANFDFSSFGMQPEVMGVFRDSSLIEEFTQRIIHVDNACTRPATLDDSRGFWGRFSYHGTPYIEKIFRLVYWLFYR